MKSQLNYGSCVCCTGRLVSSIGPKQPIELVCDSVDVIGDCGVGFPFSPPVKGVKAYDRSYLLSNLHFRARLPLYAALIRIRSEMVNAIHIYMKQNDFVNVSTPIITGNDCEGGGQVFNVKVCDDN